jgi:hypothetical protein
MIRVSNTYALDMKALLIITALLTTISGKAQFSLKKELPSMVCFFGAGFFEGTAETLQFHYSEFENKTEANADFWNPELSWRNKYKGGLPENGAKHFGSTTFLAWTTDGYHLMRTSRNVSAMVGILITPRDKLKWHGYLLKALCYSLAYQAGFHLSYTLIYS